MALFGKVVLMTAATADIGEKGTRSYLTGWRLLNVVSRHASGFKSDYAR